jgi:hypothetical protein
MMTTLQRRLLALVLASAWACAATPMLAADSGSVDAQVTVATPCLVVAPGAVDFGTLTFGSNAYAGVTYTNCGSTYEKVYGRATDADGASGAWSLSPAFVGGASCASDPVTDAYRLNVLSNASFTFSPVALSTTDQLVETVASSATGDGDRLYITMPCPGSSGGGEVMSFQITYTATF